MRVKSKGQLSGEDAVSTYSVMAVGTYLSGAPARFNGVHVKVTVTGHSPPTGKVWLLRLADGVVLPVDDTLKPEAQWVGAFSQVVLSTTVEKEGIAPAATTLAEIGVGGIYDTSPSTGDACLKVTVQDADGNAISAGSGNSWGHALKGTVVASAADTTAIESYGVSSIDMIVLVS